jgi:hypothetical protein
VPSPIFIFGFIIATLFGASFHLVLGGDMRRLATFLLAGWVGFLLGHLAGVFLAVDIMNIGTLRFFPATFGAFITLFFTQAITSQQSNR